MLWLLIPEKKSGMRDDDVAVGQGEVGRRVAAVDRGGDGVGAGGGIRVGSDRGDPGWTDRTVVAESVTKKLAVGGAKVKNPRAAGSTGLLAATMTAGQLAP